MNRMYDDHTGEMYDGSGNARDLDDFGNRKVERELIAWKLSPIASFCRGVQVGALFIGGVNTIIPGQFGVIDWPLWLRVVLGGACVLLAVNYLLAQRGYMIAKRISRA